MEGRERERERWKARRRKDRRDRDGEGLGVSEGGRKGDGGGGSRRGGRGETPKRGGRKLACRRLSANRLSVFLTKTFCVETLNCFVHVSQVSTTSLFFRPSDEYFLDFIYIEREREYIYRESVYNKVQACLGLETFTANFRPCWGFFKPARSA